MSCEERAWLTNQPGVSLCTHVFVKGFGRPRMRSRVKEARPLYSVSTTKRDREMKKTTIGSFVRGKLCEPSRLDPFGGMWYQSFKLKGTPEMKRVVRAVFAATLVVGCGSAFAETITWSGGGSVDKTDWFEAANWDLGRIPEAGDDVVINPPQGSAWHVHLTNSTPQLKSLLVRHQKPVNSSGQKTWLTCYNWNTKIWADDVTIGQGGIVTCGGPFLISEMSNRVWIVGNNLTFDNSSEDFAGRINVDCKGYRDRPVLVDSVSEPTFPGIGRLKGDNAAAYAGGGAVRIELAGELSLKYANNSISASCSGKDSNGNGDGGSIYISCGTLKGSGKIEASAADRAANNGTQASVGGNGGRIAIHYDAELQRAVMPQTTVIFARPCSQVFDTSKPYSTSNGGSSLCCGKYGSLWFPDRQFLEQDTVRGAGVWYFGDGPVSSYERNGDMELKNGYLEFPEPAAIRVRGNLTVTGPKDSLSGIMARSGLVVDGNLTASGASLILEECDLSVGGNLMLTNTINTSYFYNGGLLRTVPRSVGAGLVGSSVSVAGSFTVAKGATYKPGADPDDGSVTKLTARDVNIADGGYVYADKAGYAAKKGPGGYSGKYAGASYGGTGAYTPGNAVPVYGSYRNPVEPGSGAGYSGGGAVLIAASRALTVNGFITACANLTDKNSYTGGGSGGAVNLSCDKLYGTTGRIIVQGGKGDGTSGACAGGGGRISVRYIEDLSSGLRENCTAPAGEQGKGFSGMVNATEGTICWKPIQGLMLFVR